MPLTNQTALEGFRLRMNSLLQNDFGVQLNQEKIRYSSCQVSTFSRPLELLHSLLQRS